MVIAVKLHRFARRVKFLNILVIDKLAMRAMIARYLKWWMRNSEWALTRNTADEISFASHESSHQKERDLGEIYHFMTQLYTVKIVTRFFSYIYIHKSIDNFYLREFTYNIYGKHIDLKKEG